MPKKHSIIFYILSILLTSCYAVLGYDSPAEISEKFYNQQILKGEVLSDDSYNDDSIKQSIAIRIREREQIFGGYLSHRKIGSNRRINFVRGYKKEQIIFMFEVVYERGTTMETLVISRSKMNEPFCITSYEIENLPLEQNPTQGGTQST